MAISFGTITSNIQYGLGLLSSLLANVDIVQIYDGGLSQVFTEGRPLRATVRETSRIFEHPLESGVVIADHHVINPVEIDIPLFVQAEDYAAIYGGIRNSFIIADQFSIKTRTGVYHDMVIAQMPHEEEPEMFNAIVIGLRFKQIIYATGNGTSADSSYTPLDESMSDTALGGLQEALSLTQSLTSAATSIASYGRVLGVHL